MNKLVNIDEGHIGLLLNWGKDRREGKKSGERRWVPVVVLSHNEIHSEFVR